MRTHLLVRSIVLVVLVLGFATPAFANSMAAWVYIFPGIVSLDPILGLLPTIMVAFIERPFVSLAGIDERPLIRSLRANLLSLLAGMLLIPFADSVYYFPVGFFLLSGVSIVMTMIVELTYFVSGFQESKKFRWWWIIIGNIVSNLVLLGVCFSIPAINYHYPKVRLILMPYHGYITMTYAVASLLSLLAVFLEPVYRRRNAEPEPTVLQDVTE